MYDRRRIALYPHLRLTASVVLLYSVAIGQTHAQDLYNYAPPEDSAEISPPAPDSNKNTSVTGEENYHSLVDSPYAAKRRQKLQDMLSEDSEDAPVKSSGIRRHDDANSLAAKTAEPLPHLPVFAQENNSQYEQETKQSELIPSATPSSLPSPTFKTNPIVNIESASKNKTPDYPAVVQVSSNIPQPVTLVSSAAVSSSPVSAPPTLFAPVATEAHNTSAGIPEKNVKIASHSNMGNVVAPSVSEAVLPVSVAAAPVINSNNMASNSAAKNLALLSPAAGMSASPSPVSSESIALTEPPPTLSQPSKHIADNLPPEKRLHKYKKPLVVLDHVHKNPLEEQTEVQKHEGLGIHISIKRPKANISTMLESAYDALIAGNQEDAIIQYKQVLDAQPNNKLALFGLATTYHRAGQIKLARPLYAKLLKVDPYNVEGLNNFLVLLADESPQGALTELQQLQHTHPTFSPIPAQIAVIYEKTGDYPQAIAAMNRAITLSPENLKYRYDMAIILDKQGDWQGASAFYQQLITASDRGEKIPAKSEEIQERLTFIRSNRPNT